MRAGCMIFFVWLVVVIGAAFVVAHFVEKFW
jgi:hypothetical protein